VSERRFTTDGPTEVALKSWGFIAIVLWVVIGGGIVVASTGKILGALIDPLASFLIAGLIVVLVRPWVRFMRKHGIGRGWSTVIGMLTVLVALALLAMFFAAPVIKGANQLMSNAPDSMKKLGDTVDSTVQSFNGLPSPVKSSIENAASSVASEIAAFSQAAVSFFLGSLSTIFSLGLSIFMGLVLTIWFLLDGEKISKGILSVVPSRWRADAREIAVAFDQSFSGYLIGTAINVSVLFLLCGIGFAVIHLPGAWFLAAMLAILDVIPFVGPLIGGTIAVIVGFTVSPVTALIVLVIVLVAEQFVDSFLSPIVMGKVVTLHPVGVIFALTLGIAIAGFFGAILAIPVAAAIRVIYRYYQAKFEGSADTQSPVEPAVEET